MAHDLTEKAEILSKRCRIFGRFNGSTFVIKYGRPRDGRRGAAIELAEDSRS